MSLLDRLKSFLTPPSDPMSLWLYVKCKRCGTPVAVRVDLRNDPSLNDDASGYILRKEIMDDKCFTLMRAEITMDARHNILEKTIDKGEFITADNFNQLNPRTSSQ